MVRCFNCNIYGHYAVKCHKPKREKEQKPESNLTHIQDDEPALLLTERENNKSNTLLFNEGETSCKN